MQPGLSNTNPSVIELLTTLRAERFSLNAWKQFLEETWRMSYTMARENPRLTRSWFHLTLLLGLLALFVLVATSIGEGINPMLRVLPVLALCIAWQQCDLFWHLGLNRDSLTGELRQELGLANVLTALRGLASSVLIARLIVGLRTSSHLALAIFVVAIISDILDGAIARRTNTRSRLGQIMDGEVDATLFSALALVLIQNGSMPGWVAVVLLLRYLMPILGAVVSYMVFAHPVRFGSTLIGKWAGIFQSLYFFALLLPPNWLFFAQVITVPLLVLMLGMLVAAAGTQIIINVFFRV